MKDALEPKRTIPDSPLTSRRRLLGALAVGASAGALGFDRLAAAQGDPAAYITQTAAFGIGDGKEDEAVAALTELVAAVEKNEPGVLAYIAHRSEEDPLRVVFYEVYENEEVLRAHSQQPHLAKMGQAFQSGVFVGPLEIHKLQRIAGFSR